MSDLETALGRGRLAAEAYMKRARLHDGGWKEEIATDWLCSQAAPYVEYSSFNKRQEGVVGADWVWWWVDPLGECFGMLVQAKKLQKRGQGWFVDLLYPREEPGRQMRRLFDAADRLNVPAAYTLYCADPGYRPDLECKSHDGTECRACERAAVSIASGLTVSSVVNRSGFLDPDRTAREVFGISMPLEDMANPDLAAGKVIDVNHFKMSDDLRTFLLKPQSGARAVAKVFFETVSSMRSGQFSAVRAESLTGLSDQVFKVLPADRTHNGDRYFDHVFRGLRSRLPNYVADVLNGASPPDWLKQLSGGLVVAHVE